MIKFIKIFLLTTVLLPSIVVKCDGSDQQSQTAVLTDDELAANREVAKLIVDRIKSSIAFYAAANQQIIKSAGGEVNNLLTAIEKLQAEIKKVKDANNITALEQGIANLKEQIKNLAINIYAKGVNPADHTVNYFRQMNSILYQIYNDTFITDKLKTILSLQGEIASYLQDKMCNEGKCIAALRDLGNKASAATTDEQKVVNQTASQLLPMQAQLIGAKMQKKAFEELTPKERDLNKLNNTLNDKIAQMPESQRAAIRRNDNTAKQLSQTLNFIQNPNLAATITSDQVMSFNESSDSDQTDIQ